MSELWFPGKHLDDEYTTPTNEELAELWVAYGNVDPSKVRVMDAMYGVFIEPDKPIQAFASIDLCEVVRDTSLTLRVMTGHKPERKSDYAANTWYSADKTTPEYERSVIVSAVRAAMHSGNVQPVDGIVDIRRIMKRWRQQGIYVTANTSTLIGCEAGTITHDIGRQLSGCFDAILFPRNHDGLGPMTKASALQILAQSTGTDLESTPFIHIDDAPHHVEAFKMQLGEHTKSLIITPKTLDNHHSTADVLTETPLEAFESADAFFREQGLLKYRGEDGEET